MASEINDDITAIEEDLSTINGNGFLISLTERGVAHICESEF